MPDPHLILCWDVWEGEGSFVRDSGDLGITGTINGSVAWVDRANPRYVFASSNTVSASGRKLLSFPGIDDHEVRTPVNSIFDWVSSEFAIAVTYQRANHVDSARAILHYGDADNAGWWLDIASNAQIRYYHFGVAGVNDGGHVADTNPHRIGAAKLNGIVYVYLDGVRGGSAAIGNSGTISTYLALGGRHANGGTSAANGKGGQLAIYKGTMFKTVEEMDAFFYNDWAYWQSK